MKKILLPLLVITICFPVVLFGAEKRVLVTNILMSDSLVVADIEIQKLLSDDLMVSLSKGMTAALEYQVQLWQERPGWADKLINEKYSRIKISYDPWQKKFSLQTSAGAIEQMRVDSLKVRCSKINQIKMVPPGRLDKKSNYYIAVRVVINPMSVENVEEIRRWLSGEAKEFDPKSIKLRDKPGRKAGNWFVRLFLNVTGFGDKVISGKSKPFRYRKAGVD